MEGFLATLEWPSAASWGALAFGVAFGVVAQTHSHVRRAFHQWRLDRRLARDPYILREEMKEYSFAIGDELEPLRFSGVIGRSLPGGLVFAFGAWLLENELHHWWDIGEAAFLAGALLFGFWRWLNDPPARQLPDQDPEPADLLSRDSGLGFAGAVTIVMLLLLAAIMFF